MNDRARYHSGSRTYPTSVPSLHSKPSTKQTHKKHHKAIKQTKQKIKKKSKQTLHLAYPQLVSDRVFLIIKGNSLNTGQRRCIDDAEGIVGHNPSVLVEGQLTDLQRVPEGKIT